MPKCTSCCNIQCKGNKVLPFLVTSEVIQVPSKEETPYFSSDNGNDDKEGGKEEGNNKDNNKDGEEENCIPNRPTIQEKGQL